MHDPLYHLCSFIVNRLFASVDINAIYVYLLSRHNCFAESYSIYQTFILTAPIHSLDERKGHLASNHNDISDIFDNTARCILPQYN